MSEIVIAPFRNMPLTESGLAGQVPTHISAEFFEQVARLLEALQIATGSGSPEGVLEAGENKLYRDTGTNTVYIKTTATGNTGWAAV